MMAFGKRLRGGAEPGVIEDRLDKLKQHCVI
jgi:hypothetical protein